MIAGTIGSINIPSPTIRLQFSKRWEKTPTGRELCAAPDQMRAQESTHPVDNYPSPGKEKESFDQRRRQTSAARQQAEKQSPFQSSTGAELLQG